MIPRPIRVLNPHHPTSIWTNLSGGHFSESLIRPADPALADSADDACHAEGRGFESLHPLDLKAPRKRGFRLGSARLPERQRTGHNPEQGSLPRLELVRERSSNCSPELRLDAIGGSQAQVEPI